MKSSSDFWSDAPETSSIRPRSVSERRLGSDLNKTEGTRKIRKNLSKSSSGGEEKGRKCQVIQWFLKKVWEAISANWTIGKTRKNLSQSSSGGEEKGRVTEVSKLDRCSLRISKTTRHSAPCNHKWDLRGWQAFQARKLELDRANRVYFIRLVLLSSKFRPCTSGDSKVHGRKAESGRISLWL